MRPVFEKTNKIRISLQNASVQNSTINNYNWAGVIKNNTVRARVTGFWRQPLATAPTSNRPAYSSQWMGLGGVNQGVLIQAGTESNIFTDGSGGYNVWYEIVGTNLSPYQINITNLTHSAGDTYYADIKFTKGSSSSSASFYISDSTQNTTTSFTVSNINYTSDLTSAEWIFERPNIGGSPAPNLTKPDVGYVHFILSSSASTPTGSVSYVTDSDDKAVMRNSTNTATLASPGTVGTSGEFDANWYAYK